MNKKLIIRISIFYLITVLIGTLSHFAYSTFKFNNGLKVIFPINESTFEHLKLFFYPFIFTSLIEGFIYKEDLKSFIAKRGFIISFIMFFEIFYISIMTHLFGINTFINVSSYYILILISYLISLKLDQNNKVITVGGFINLAVWIIIFIYFTYNPLDSLIFIDPSK